MPKLSIIVPIYNSSKYLYKCINSLLSQTLNNIEIILVDDCSTDNSLNIIINYQKLYPEKIKVLRNNENKGAGYSRNKGLLIATGEYIGFIDSDDYIEPDMYEKMYVTAVNNNDDIVVTNMDLKYLGLDLSFLSRKCSNEQSRFDINENKEYLVSTKPSCCNKIYRNHLLKKESFPEDLKWEDYPFTLNIISKSTIIECLDNTSYHYRINVFGTTCTDLRKVNRKMLDIFDGSDMLEQKMLDNKLLSEFEAELRTVQIANSLGRVKDLLFTDISKEDKILLMNYLVNLIEIKYGDWENNEWYQIQKKISRFYGMRMNYIENHFLNSKLRTENNEVKLKQKIKSTLDGVC